MDRRELGNEQLPRVASDDGNLLLHILFDRGSDDAKREVAITMSDAIPSLTHMEPVISEEIVRTVAG